MLTALRVSIYAILGLTLLSGSGPGTRPAHAADRLVVKYRAGLDACVECLLNSGARFAGATGSDELDALHHDLGVTAAHPLFVPVESGRRAAGGTADRVRRARARFPQRAQRAAAVSSAPDLSNIYVLELASTVDVNAAARRYAAAEGVEWAHPDYEYTPTFVPNDPFYASSGTWGQSYADLWGMHVTEAATAWETSSGNGIVIGVVDSGIDAGHPDIAGNLWSNAGEIPDNDVDDDGNGFVDDAQGWDFISNDNTPEDLLGHGTHVAGTAAAAGDNSVGVVGMAWESQVMPVRVFGTGSAPVSVIAEGIIYAAENGADVINASFSGPAVQVIVDAVELARSLGVIVVAAAGNDAADASIYAPASLPGVITVSASAANDTPASFTNFGDAVSVAAPGVDVLSLQAAGTALGPVVTNGYLRLSGTSMATPHAAGLVALLLAEDPGLDEDAVRWHLELNADQPGIDGWETTAWNPYLGYGRIDAGRVFDAPPVTARLRPVRVERHVHAGGAASLPDAALSFTTHDPVSWSLISAPWILPDVPAGIGAASIPLSIDASSLNGGETLSGTVSATSAEIVSSESYTATVHVHDDHRSAAEIPIDINASPFFPTNPSGVGGPFTIRMASNGQRALVVWGKPSSVAGRLQGAIVDDAGVIAGPFTISQSNPRHWFDVASDGQNFMVVWIENADDYLEGVSLRRIAAARVFADGTQTPNEQQDPIDVDARTYPPYHLAYFPRIAFDGAGYIVAWQRRDIRVANGRPYRTWVYYSRLASDGTPSGKRKRLALRDADRRRPVSGVEVACLTGSCVFTWKQDFRHHFVRVVGDRPDYRNRRDFVHPYYYSADDFVAGNDGYLLVGRTSESCLLGNLSCARGVRGVRVDATGTPIDTALIPLMHGTMEPGTRSRHDLSAAFDGTDYLITFGLPAIKAGSTLKTPVFLARLAPDGTVRELEQEGGLVNANDSAGRAAVTTVNGRLLVAWRDARDATASTPNAPAFSSVYAQPLAP